MCGAHWAMVPSAIQCAVYAAYVPGQCEWEPLPSVKWHRAADAAICAVAVKEDKPVTVTQVKAMLKYSAAQLGTTIASKIEQAWGRTRSRARARG